MNTTTPSLNSAPSRSTGPHGPRSPRRSRQWAAGARLGVHLALRARSWITLAVVLCTAVGTVSLVAALSMPHIIGERTARAEARSPYHQLQENDQPAADQVSFGQRSGSWNGEPVTRILLSVPDNPATPLPPGLSQWPRPGQTIVSPALRTALDAGKPDRVRDQFGQVIGTVTEPGLLHPDENLAYVAIAPDVPATGLTPIDGFGRLPDTTDYGSFGDVPQLSGPIRTLLTVATVAICVPLAMLVLGSSALMRERRRRTLASLDLLGVPARTVRLITTAEVVLVAVAGWAVGVLATTPLLRAAATWPPEPAAWFPSDVAWQGGPALATMGFFVLAAIVTALRTTDRLRTHRAPRHLARLAPLTAGVGILAGIAAYPWAPDAQPRGWVIYLGIAALVLAVTGLAWAGPVLVRAVGIRLARRNTPWLALGSGRLAADPHTGTLGALAITLAVAASGVVGAITGQIAYIDTELYRTDPTRSATTISTQDLPAVREALPASATALTPVTVTHIRTRNGSTHPLTNDPFLDLTVNVMVGDCKNYLTLVGQDPTRCAQGTVSLQPSPFPNPLPQGGSIDLALRQTDTASGRPLRFPLPGQVLRHEALPGVAGTALGADLSLLVDEEAWEQAGGPPLHAGTVLLSTRDANTATVRAQALAADPAAEVQSDAAAYSERLQRTGHYRGWFTSAAIVTLGVATAFVLVSALTTLIERRRVHAYLGIVGVPPRALGRAWALYSILPVLILLPAAWLLTFLTDLGFDRLVRIPVRIDTAPYISGAATALLLTLLIQLIARTSTPREVPLDALRTRE
ncbi:hypothetical protein V1J52_22130 [Streptomyces sp. TRM 70351]|uniref:hypothetical protein n=1 Tax=Streptomyces sp. TRM 70351 TaxID=3116552 RepID=UPI002E7B9C1B|nr:hypothetical protein [Streptomyces sp. TRM 70351]MEE1930846.1 hypothetical protein [Streptomyces sp. TRM 70351]